MITDYGFTDTEDDIHLPTPEEDDAYHAEHQEYKADAAALLATVRHLLTGHEIDTLESVLDDDRYSDGVDVSDIDRLRLQFYAQICNHKDGRATA